MARIPPTPKVINRLYALSGNLCAFPDCGVKLVSSTGNENIADVSHIEAAEKGGPRYNPNSNDTERRSFENLILLCKNHNKIIDDNPNKYTVNVLREMKSNHEDKISRLLYGQGILSKYPLVLATVINYVGTKIFDNEPDEILNAPNIEEKILYNDILRYKPIIEEYVIYQAVLNDLYEEIENQGSTKKEFILQNIRNIYLQEKGIYNNLADIRINADNIIDNVKNKLWSIIENSTNIDVDLPYEAIDISILIILVDAFMRCNILEEPLNDNK